MRPALRRIAVAAWLAAGPACAGEPAGAEYYPLREGMQWVYAYRNVVTVSGRNARTNVTEGRITLRVAGTVTTNGFAYVRTVADFDGLFGMSPQATLLRRADDGVRIANHVRGELVDTLLLALPIEAGRSWDYVDGVAGTRRVESIEQREFGGRWYDRCVKVVRDYTDPETQNRFSSENYYAPGIGEVRFVFRQQVGVGSSVTETTLESFQE